MVVGTLGHMRILTGILARAGAPHNATQPTSAFRPCMYMPHRRHAGVAVPMWLGRRLRLHLLLPSILLGLQAGDLEPRFCSGHALHGRFAREDGAQGRVGVLEGRHALLKGCVAASSRLHGWHGPTGIIRMDSSLADFGAWRRMARLQGGELLPMHLPIAMYCTLPPERPALSQSSG